MNRVDRDEKNVKRCPKCGDTMGINLDSKPICACSVPPRSKDIERPHKTK